MRQHNQMIRLDDDKSGNKNRFQIIWLTTVQCLATYGPQHESFLAEKEACTKSI